MTLVADRFLVDEEEGILDLATGETVRLTIAPALSRTERAARSALCDRLCLVRHPLLIPLIDYGGEGPDFFEAHSCLPPLRVSGADARRAALHLVRFLSRVGATLTADAAVRHVRPAIDGAASGWRPIGTVLKWRPQLDEIRTVLESAGPPGVTAIAVHAPEGSGLRTARLQLARAARLAGYAVVDSRFGALPELLFPPRHLCVLDWLTVSPALPVLLSVAGAAGAHRHAWIRFSRQPIRGAGSLELEPFVMRDLMDVVFADPDLGPTEAEVKLAAVHARGRPASLISALCTTRASREASWVHETSPEYFPSMAHQIETHVPLVDRGAGVGRLIRAADAAVALAHRGRHARAVRVLARAAEGLDVRGARAEAARAWCALGQVHLARGRPRAALKEFRHALTAGPDPETALRALVGTGRAALELGNLPDAEAAFRTATLAAEHGALAESACVDLAFTLFLRRRFDAACEVLGARSPALLSRIEWTRGDLSAAAGAAHQAIDAAKDAHDASASAEAHVAAARIAASLGDVEAVRRHDVLAREAARRMRRPVVAFRVAADVLSALERCGAVVRPERKRRLLRVARGLPPLVAAQIRAAVGGDAGDATELRRFVEQSGAVVLMPEHDDRSDLIERFRALVDAIHATPDEASALQAIAGDLLTAASACSVVIRSSRVGAIVASAGRGWPGETPLTQPILEGGEGVFREGVAPEAAEPVRAARSTLGSIAVRWVSGSSPRAPRARDLLRVAAAAAVPLLRAFTVAQPQAGAGESQFPDHLLGRGSSAERVRDAVRRAATAPYPVLIEGESGSGKELVARAIHARSTRRTRQFCAVNCAALTDDLLEAELFGHARGAFTGATAERHGLFEEADQGTLLLDEVAELSARAQAKLLRVLQEGEVRRIGENMPRRIDTRIVAATNRSIEDEVRAGRFRADLRFRLDVIRIVLPPLRDRADEVPWMAQRLWAEAASRVGTRATLGDEAIAALARYDWPGNVRELQNVIASLAVHAPRRGRLAASLLPEHIAASGAREGRGLDEARLDFERRFIRAALARAGGRKAVAADQLGVTRQGLDKMIKRLGLTTL
jgi:DNA-binding NtrC family response regulator/tetratricopeptide (TPR) repeat protein